jgi:hypothetical protein
MTQTAEQKKIAAAKKKEKKDKKKNGAHNRNDSASSAADISFDDSDSRNVPASKSDQVNQPLTSTDSTDGSKKAVTPDIKLIVDSREDNGLINSSTPHNLSTAPSPPKSQERPVTRSADHSHQLAPQTPQTQVLPTTTILEEPSEPSKPQPSHIDLNSEDELPISDIKMWLARLTSSIEALTKTVTLNNSTQELKLDHLEQKMLTKHQELNDTIASTIALQLTQVNQSVHVNTLKAEKNTSDIKALHELMASQATSTNDNKLSTDKASREIIQLRQQLTAQAAELATLKTMMQQGDATARRDALEALVLVNDVESHHRKWAVRILGHPAPDGIENKAV